MFAVSPSLRLLTLLAAVSTLSACTSVGYRCPLDPSDDPDSPTACAGMHDAMQGAKQGGGSRTSVLVDAEGRQIPRAMRDNKPRSPLAGTVDEGAPEPYRTKAGDPIFEPPRVYQTWVRSFVDAEGNLHEGHHTWFSTPGRWRYGNLRDSGEAGGSGDLMRPGMPGERLQGRVQAPTAVAPTAVAASAPPKQVSDKAALSNLSAAAGAMNNKQVPSQAAPGVTAPAVNLSE